MFAGAQIKVQTMIKKWHIFNFCIRDGPLFHIIKDTAAGTGYFAHIVIAVI